VLFFKIQHNFFFHRFYFSFSQMVQPNLSSHQKLEPFLLLSKSAKGVANCKLIIDALNAPGVYVFTELYEAPNVVEVCIPFAFITTDIPLGFTVT
jgi:hypothetical protein